MAGIYRVNLTASGLEKLNADFLSRHGYACERAQLSERIWVAKGETVEDASPIIRELGLEPDDYTYELDHEDMA